MLVSPTRPITPESSWVPCRLPKPTRHPIGFFFPLPYTQVPLYMNSFFFPSPHTQMQLCGSRFFFPSPYTQVPLYSNGFFFPSPYTQIQLVPSQGGGGESRTGTEETSPPWATDSFVVHIGGTADDSPPSGMRTADLKICGWLRYHSTRLGCCSSVSPHCLEPSQRKHALGYATRMTPKKGGYTTPAPALHLTTSLRGNFSTVNLAGSFCVAKLPGVDHYGCQTLQQSRGSWVAQCTPEEMSRNNLAGSLCV